MIKIYNATINASASVDEQSVAVWESVGWTTSDPNASNESEQNPAPAPELTVQPDSKGKTNTSAGS